MMREMTMIIELPGAIAGYLDGDGIAELEIIP